MRVAVTGAEGLVGRALTRLLSRAHLVTALGHRELDITDEKAVQVWMRRERPDAVINCAALGVDDCEADPERARAINVRGPRELARAAAETGVLLVHLSSNYVFDGRRTDGGFYTVEDTPDPINVYGKTKWEGERAVLAAWPESAIVRTSWVFGPGKQSFLCTVHRRLWAGERVRAITDTRASATYVEDLASRIAAIVQGRQFGIAHVINAGACTYYEFAKEAGRALGLPAARVEALVEPVREEDARRAAPRPASTPMDSRPSAARPLPPMRPWPEALTDYIKTDIAARTAPVGGRL